MDSETLSNQGELVFRKGRLGLRKQICRKTFKEGRVRECNLLHADGEHLEFLLIVQASHCFQTKQSETIVAFEELSVDLLICARLVHCL